MKIIEALKFLELYIKLRDQSLPLKTPYKLSKLARRLETEQAFYQDKLRKILSQYAEKDENGEIKFDENGNATFAPEVIRKCEKEIVELQNFKIEDIEITFTLDELEALQITPLELNCLFPLITE
jgi:hypothetical protein